MVLNYIKFKIQKEHIWSTTGGFDDYLNLSNRAVGF